MADEKVTSDEILKDIIQEPTVNGFRKGMTKKKLIKSMDENDWVFLDKAKEAEDKMANKYSYQFFVKSDQMNLNIMTSIRNCKDMAIKLLVNEHEMKQSEVDISVGRTEQIANDTKKPVTVEELKLANMKKQLIGEQICQNLMVELGHLYAFVGRMGLDRKVIFTEEQYNELVEDLLQQVGTTRFSFYQE